MVDEAEIREALQMVEDPELGISIQGGKDNRYWNYNQS